MGAKIKEYSSSQEVVAMEGKTNTQVDEIKNLRLNQLVNFKDHPFKVETNTELFELMQSIEKQDVSSEEKLFWSYFMNDKGELEYYKLCEQCKNDCKQSFRIIGLKCLEFKTS